MAEKPHVGDNEERCRVSLGAKGSGVQNSGVQACEVEARRGPERCAQRKPKRTSGSAGTLLGVDDNTATRRTLQFIRRCDQHVAAMQQGTVQPESELDLDNDVTEPRHLSFAICNAAWGSADHLLTVRHLLTSSDREGVRPLASYTLARAAIENAALALWLIHPPDRPERLRRAYRLALADLRDSGRAAKIHGLQSRPHEERVAEVTHQAQSVGLTDIDLRKHDSWTEIVAGADNALKRDKRDVQLMWQICSGFTHARDWARLAVLERGEMIAHGDDTLMVSMTVSFPALCQAAWLTELMLRETARLYEHRRKKWTTKLLHP